MTWDSDPSDLPDAPSERAHMLQDMLVARATGSAMDENLYIQLRKEFMNDSSMNLAPSQHTEEIFKTILGSCQQVVNSLGTLRNKIGDAHGQGRQAVRPSPRHAALAVNLAGSMATFMVETWKARQ